MSSDSTVSMPNILYSQIIILTQNMVHYIRLYDKHIKSDKPNGGMK